MQVRKEFSQPEQIAEQPQKSVSPDAQALTTSDHQPDQTHAASDKEKDHTVNDQPVHEAAAHSTELNDQMAQPFVVGQPAQVIPASHASYYHRFQPPPKQAQFAAQPMYALPAPYQPVPNFDGRVYGSVMVMPMSVYQPPARQVAQPACQSPMGTACFTEATAQHPWYQPSYGPMPPQTPSWTSSGNGQITQQINCREQMLTTSSTGRTQPIPAESDAEASASYRDGLEAPAIFKTPNRQRVVVWNYCQFCQNNREPEEVYRSHTLRDSSGRVVCPVLRSYNCPICNNGGGDRAHTRSYCPQLPKKNCRRRGPYHHFGQ